MLALILGGLTWTAVMGPAAAAKRPALFTGSLVLADTRPLTVIDVATAQITVRLVGVDGQVGAINDSQVQPVPVDGGTILVNRLGGNFNFLEPDDYVTDPGGPGVGLGRLPGTIGAFGLASGRDAYIVRSGPVSTVSLVGQPTVAAAAKATGRTAAVPPLGYDRIAGQISLRPGSAAVAGSTLWVLAAGPTGCQVVRLRPDGQARQGLDPSSPIAPPGGCDRDGLEAGSAAVGVAWPGRVQLFPGKVRPGRPGSSQVDTPFTSDAGRILPVTGTESELWYLAQRTTGWELFGVATTGRVDGPYPLTGFDPGSDPVVPVLAGGFLYTLDQASTGQPTLWTIDVANGHMAPLRGTPAYPARDGAERAAFAGAQVLLDGPRVIFNNPGSLEAVVVFTDSNRLPVVVDKSQAVTVSTTGPADLHEPATAAARPTKPGQAGRAAVRTPVPAVQPVSQRVTCATTTQKPYAPQITAVEPSSGAALVQWSYQLLDQTDCEPASWAVRVRALTGAHQPARPLQVVYGQSQYLFIGLRPATSYQVVVTAYINRQSTPSTPATFTTTARGPDAPLQVQSSADGRGDWVVSWTPCTEAAHPDCVVPATQWSVIGAACSGRYVGVPPTVRVPGGVNRVVIDAGALGMLGDSLSFAVQGSLASGLTGDPTADRSCTEAWRAPDPTRITLTGAGTAQPDGTITATLGIVLQGDPTSVLGSQLTDFVYRVGGRSVGPTTDLQATLAGLPPATALTPTVVVYPAGHPDSAVTVIGAAFSKTLSWPDLSGLTATGRVDPADPNSGTFTVTFPPDLPDAPLQAVGPDADSSGPQLQCGGPGGAVIPLAAEAVKPDRTLEFGLTEHGGTGGLIDTGGSCAVRLRLTDTASPDPYGGPSETLDADFTIGVQPDYSYTTHFVGDCTGDFKCGPLGQPYQLDVDGSAPFAGGGDWAARAADPNVAPTADLCRTDPVGLPTPPVFPYILTLPQTCVHPERVEVTVTFTYLGQSRSVDAGRPTNSPGSPATTTTTSTSSTTSSTSSSTASSTTASSSTASTGASSPPSSSAGANPLALVWSLLVVVAWRLTAWRRRNREKGAR